MRIWTCGLGATARSARAARPKSPMRWRPSSRRGSPSSSRRRSTGREARQGSWPRIARGGSSPVGSGSCTPRRRRGKLIASRAARPISIKLIEDTARERMAGAAIDIPADYREGVRRALDCEQNRIAGFVLTEMDRNWDIATAERRPMCADTGLPRYYVRAGNEALVEGGFVALER